MISGIGITCGESDGEPFVGADPTDGLADAEVDDMRATAEGVQAWTRAGVSVLEPPKTFEVELLRAEQDEFDHTLRIARAVVVNPKLGSAFTLNRKAEAVGEAKTIFVLGCGGVEVEGTDSVFGRADIEKAREMGEIVGHGSLRKKRKPGAGPGFGWVCVCL